MAAISMTTFWNAFSWRKVYEFWLICHGSLFLVVQQEYSSIDSDNGLAPQFNIRIKTGVPLKLHIVLPNWMSPITEVRSRNSHCWRYTLKPGSNLKLHIAVPSYISPMIGLSSKNSRYDIYGAIIASWLIKSNGNKYVKYIHLVKQFTLDIFRGVRTIARVTTHSGHQRMCTSAHVIIM